MSTSRRYSPEVRARAVRPLLAWGWMVASMAAGCGQGGAVHSDAGLPVDSVRLAAGPEITWHEEPLFVVGAPDGEGGEMGAPLHLVMDARIRSDSGLVIVQRLVQSLLLFDREGTLQASIGSDGDGPGEFRRPRQALLLPGDSVLAWDYVPQRLSVFDGSGGLGEVISLAPKGLRGNTILDLHLVGTEAVAGVSEPLGTPPYFRRTGLSRDEHSLQFLDRQGGELGTARIQGWEWYQDERSMAVPYGYRLYVAGGHRGLFVGHGRGPRLTEFAVTGEPRRVLQLPIEREVLSRAEVFARVEEWANETLGPELRDSGVRTMRASIPAAGIDSTSAFNGLVSDRDGRLWVKVSGRSRDEPGRWLVVDPVANEAEWARGHPGWTVLDAAHGLVAAIREDDFGREMVGVFGIRR